MKEINIREFERKPYCKNIHKYIGDSVLLNTQVGHIPNYSKTFRYADFGPKLISVAVKTVYLEITENLWKLYLSQKLINSVIFGKI